jgi:hypothetical protein
MNQMPGQQMPGQQMSAPLNFQMIGQQPPGVPGINGRNPPMTMLERSQQRQKQITNIVRVLEGIQKDARLPSGSRRRLQAIITSANKKRARQEAILTGIAERNDKGLMTSNDQQRLTALLAQQQAVLQSLEAYRQNAGEILARRDLAAVQGR